MESAKCARGRSEGCGKKWKQASGEKKRESKLSIEVRVKEKSAKIRALAIW